MRPISVSVVVDAPLGAVWDALSDLPSHTEWMADAASIEFPAGQAGTGTEMLVDTRLGPFRLTDRLEIIAWEPPRTMAVEHRGVVRGWGRFDLIPMADGIHLTWTEDLRFPWWLGGPITALAAHPLLSRIWAGNLRRFRRRVVSDP